MGLGTIDPEGSESIAGLSIIYYPIPSHIPQKARLKSDSEIGYFFELFYLLLAWP